MAFLLMLAVLGIGLYLLPWIVATNRGHRNSGAILVLNLFLGWTFFGWVMALVWACTDNCAPRPAIIYAPPPSGMIYAAPRPARVLQAPQNHELPPTFL